MKKQKLNYRFHNPNTAEVTANYILKVFIEVNAKKVDRVMQEVAERKRTSMRKNKRFGSTGLLVVLMEKGETDE